MPCLPTLVWDLLLLHENYSASDEEAVNQVKEEVAEWISWTVHDGLHWCQLIG
jgi:hypothetical protein